MNVLRKTPCNLIGLHALPTHSEATEPVIKHRTYDPETKTLKKRTDEDVEMDTVENRIEGLAEKIIEEDTQQRAQDLVNSFIPLHCLLR